MFTRCMFLFALVLSCVFGLIAQPVLAAPTTPREVITAANANKLQPLFKLGKGVIRHLDWSPDGKQLFVSTYSGVYIYNPNDLKQEPRLLDPNGSNGVAFNIAGTKLATFADYRSVSIWDAKTLKKIDQIDIPDQGDQRYRDPIRAVWFDQEDVPIIAYAPDELDLSVWNSQTRGYLIEKQGIFGVYEVQVNSDRQMMLTSGGRMGGSEPAELWDLKTGKQIRELKIEDGSLERINVNAAVFNSTDTLIATANGNAPTDASNYLIGNVIILWDSQTGKQLRTLKGHDSWVMQVVFHPKGELIASGSGDGTVRLWNVKTGKQMALFQTGTVNALAFNPSGTLLAAGTEGGELNMWNVSNHALLGKINDFNGYIGPIYTMGVDTSNEQCCITFTRDSKQIAHGQGNGLIQSWDTSTGKRIAIVDGHAQAISGLTYANKETVLISTSYDSVLRYWNAASGRPIYKKEFPTNDDYLIPYALKSSPDGKYMTTKLAPHRGVVWLYSTISHQKIWDNSKFILNNVDEAYELPNVFSPDARFLAFVSNTVNYQLYLYEIGTRKDPLQIPLSCDASGGCTNVPENLAFSADGKRLYVSFRDGAIDVLDMERRQVISSLPYLPSTENSDTPTVTQFNGTIAVSHIRYSVSNGVIYVRDLQSGQLLQHYETKNVFEYSLNPQGTLVAWSGDKLQLWSIETGNIVFEQPSLLNWSSYYGFSEIGFSPDGTLLAVADGADVITVYGIPPN